MLDSMIEFSKDSLSDILKKYIDAAIANLNHDNEDYAKQAIKVVTRRRLFGLRSPLAINPTPAEAVKIAKEKLKWYGYSKHSYKARRLQAKYFQDMMDRSDPESKFFISVDDYSMLAGGDYSSKASWNANNWDTKTDPVLQDSY